MERRVSLQHPAGGAPPCAFSLLEAKLAGYQLLQAERPAGGRAWPRRRQRATGAASAPHPVMLGNRFFLAFCEGVKTLAGAQERTASPRTLFQTLPQGMPPASCRLLGCLQASRGILGSAGTMRWSAFGAPQGPAGHTAATLHIPHPPGGCLQYLPALLVHPPSPPEPPASLDLRA